MSNSYSCSGGSTADSADNLEVYRGEWATALVPVWKRIGSGDTLGLVSQYHPGIQAGGTNPTQKGKWAGPGRSLSSPGRNS